MKGYPSVKLARTLSQDAKKMDGKNLKNQGNALFGELNIPVERAFKDLTIHLKDHWLIRSLSPRKSVLKASLGLRIAKRSSRFA